MATCRGTPGWSNQPARGRCSNRGCLKNGDFNLPIKMWVNLSREEAGLFKRMVGWWFQPLSGSRVPFGFHADFDPALNPVMGFELFWHDADLCGTSFGCSDAQDDPGTGGGSISWATWAQNITDDCRSSPAGSFYQTGNWGEIVFDDGNGLGPALQLPGDCNQDGALDLSDALCALGVLFTGVPPLFPCGNGLPTDPGNIALLDWQSDGAIDLSDVLGLLQFFFFSAYAHPLAVPGSETTACVVVQGCEDNSSCP